MNLSAASEYGTAGDHHASQISYRGVALLSMRQSRIVIGDAVTGGDGTVEGGGVRGARWRIMHHDVASVNIKLALMLSSKIQQPRNLAPGWPAQISQMVLQLASGGNNRPAQTDPGASITLVSHLTKLV